MREFRFRIWFEDFKHMYYEKRPGEVFREHKNLNSVIMQATEVFDINDVEVYEGDYVKFLYFDPIFKEKELVGKIEFVEGNFVIDCFAYGYVVSLNEYIYEEMEIIGNFYEGIEELLIGNNGLM